MTGLTFPYGSNILSMENINKFSTIWIVNQSPRNKFYYAVTAIALKAKIIYFRKNEKFTQTFDGDIIPKFEKFLENHDFKENLLTVVHFMGSHFTYKERYPKFYQINSFEIKKKQEKNILIQNCKSNLKIMFPL